GSWLASLRNAVKPFSCGPELSIKTIWFPGPSVVPSIGVLPAGITPKSAPAISSLPSHILPFNCGVSPDIQTQPTVLQPATKPLRKPFKNSGVNTSSGLLEGK